MIRLLAILIILLVMPRNEVKMSRVTLVDKLSKVANLSPDEMQLLSTMFNGSNAVSGWLPTGGKDPTFDFCYMRRCSMEVIPLGYSSVSALSHAAIANTTETVITFDVESVVDAGDYGLIDWSAADPTKIIAKSNHRFLFQLYAKFASDADGYRYITIKYFNADGSSLYDPGIQASAMAVNGEVTVLQATASYPLKTGQYACMYVYHSAGGNLAVVSKLGYFAVR